MMLWVSKTNESVQTDGDYYHVQFSSPYFKSACENVSIKVFTGRKQKISSFC